MALLLLASVVLMTLGYQQASTTVWWGRQTAWVGANNVLVYPGFYWIAGSQVGAPVAREIRHPQLAAVKLWALAHLLVNGDSASLLLFGCLLVWAVLEVVIINKQDGKPRLSKPQPSQPREFAAIAITLLIYGVAAYLHGLLGYPVHG
tara:strand:+ start:547 stop:990 length:444 start_codon:yes stop_codon:yes gene_type:complete